MAQPGALSEEKLRCGQRILEAAGATEKESGNGRALHRINYKHLISGRGCTSEHFTLQGGCCHSKN